MSCFLPEKQQILPYKKAWRSFTCKLQSKLQKLTRLKNIEQATTNILRHLPRSPKYALRLKKKLNVKQLQHHSHRNFATIYIDGHFRSQDEWMGADQIEAPMEEAAEESAATMELTCLATEDASSSSSSSSYTSCASACSSPVSEASFSVDERAEMFIAKVKQDMRLQKQRSIENYLEMLARGL